MPPEHIKELIQYRIEKSKSALEDARIAIEHKRFLNASNRIYYSIFYSVSALALSKNFQTSKHTQLLGWFNQHFVNTGIVTKEFGKKIMQLLLEQGKRVTMTILLLSNRRKFLPDLKTQNVLSMLLKKCNYLSKFFMPHLPALRVVDRFVLLWQAGITQIFTEIFVRCLKLCFSYICEVEICSTCVPNGTLVYDS